MKPGDKIDIWEKPNEGGKKFRGTLIKTYCRVGGVESWIVHLDCDAVGDNVIISIPYN